MTDIHQRIQANAEAISKCLPLPHIATREAEVVRLTPLALLDACRKADLQMAVMAVEEAKAHHARHQALLAEQQALQQELNAFEHGQRMAQIELANKALLRAEQEYMAAGMALCRAYRRVLDQSKRNHLVAGAKTNLPRGFDFQPAVPYGWQGSADEIMRQGLLPFEKGETEQAA